MANPLNNISHTHFLRCKECQRLIYIRICADGADKPAQEILHEGGTHRKIHGNGIESIRIDGQTHNEWYEI